MCRSCLQIVGSFGERSCADQYPLIRQNEQLAGKPAEWSCDLRFDHFAPKFHSTAIDSGQPKFQGQEQFATNWIYPGKTTKDRPALTSRLKIQQQIKGSG